MGEEDGGKGVLGTKERNIRHFKPQSEDAVTIVSQGGHGYDKGLGASVIIKKEIGIPAQLERT